MTVTYTPRGVCSREMKVEVEDGVIRNVTVIGGCNGNLQGICKLVQGRRAEEVHGLLKGIRCGGKPTSCPDQLSVALEKAMKEEQK